VKNNLKKQNKHKKEACRNNKPKTVAMQIYRDINDMDNLVCAGKNKVKFKR